LEHPKINNKNCNNIFFFIAGTTLIAGCCVGTGILFGLAGDDSSFCASFVCFGVALQWKDVGRGVVAGETLS
jgi:hypothetical protein